MKKLFMFMTVVIFAAFCFSCGNDDLPDPKPNDPQQDTLVPDEPKPDEPKPDEPNPDEPIPDEPNPDEPNPDANGTFVYEGEEYKIGDIILRNRKEIIYPIGKETECNKWTIDCYDVAKTKYLEIYFATPINTVDSQPEIPNGDNVIPLDLKIFEKDGLGFVSYGTEYKESTMNIVLKKNSEDQFNGDFKAEVTYVDDGVDKKVTIDYTGDFYYVEVIIL